MKKWQKRYSKFAEENQGVLILRNEDGLTKAWGRSAEVLSKVMDTYIGRGKHDGDETGVCDFARVERALQGLNFSYLLIENGEIAVRYEGRDPFNLPCNFFLIPSVEATPAVMRDKASVCVLLGAGRPQVRIAEVLSYQEAAIEQAVQDGYRVFVTCMYAGFELEAAKTVIRLKEKNEQLKLVLVKPLIAQIGINWRTQEQLNEVEEQADWVEVLYTDKDLGWQQTVHWMVQRAKRIVYATDNPDRKCVKYSQLKAENLSGKEVFYLQPGPKPERKKEKGKKAILYPENLLRELYGPEITGALQEFPEDVQERIVRVLKYNTTEKRREFFMLRYRYGWTFREIGEKYHCSKQSVQSAVSTEIGKIKKDYLFMDYIRGKRDRP